MNTIDGTSVVYSMAEGVYADAMADVWALCAATDVTQNKLENYVKHAPTNL